MREGEVIKLCKGCDTNPADKGHWGYCLDCFVEGRKLRYPQEFTREEERYVYGSILGDGGLRKNGLFSYFRKARKSSLEISLQAEAVVLTRFHPHLHPLQVNGFPQVTLTTGSAWVIDEVRKQCYREGVKVVTLEMLNKIDEQGLTYWYQDDGSYHSTKHYIDLCTQSFSFGEHELMVKWFRNTFDLWPIITRQMGKTEMLYHLRFHNTEARKFLEIVKPYIHPNFIYKLGA